MEIRKLDGLEQQQALYVWSQAFERGERDMEDWREWEEQMPTGRTTYGIFDAGGLQATFLLVNEEITLGLETRVPMGAVCGVAVLPASRGKGYASLGVKYLFERMRDMGQAISFLEPFSWEFYRRLGYEWTAPTRRYSVPTRILQADPETENVRAAMEEDRPRIIACYNRIAGRYRGMVVRRPEVWNWLLADKRKHFNYTYLYERDGVVEGYINYDGGKREETRLDDFLTETPRAQRGLLGLLRRHEMQTDKFVWDAPADDTLWSQFYHWDIETKLRMRHMARIVDVRHALSEWRPEPSASGSVTFALQDEAAPWNAGVWKVEFAGGRVLAKPTEHAPQVTLDIQALTQAYMGTPTAVQLRQAGRLTVHDEAGFAALEQLFAGPIAWCNDGF
jgi:predicted acetyltransferase